MTTFFDAYSDLQVQGGPVRLYRGGDVDAPPVLLLHGAMLDTGPGVWRDVAPDLARDHGVHVIDLPRHGGSRPWSGTLDDARLRRILHELLDQLALPRMALVGLSMGAGLAIGCALERPERISSLVAIGPGGIGARRPGQFATWAVLRTPGLLRALSWYLARSPEVVRRSMREELTAREQTDGFQEIARRVIDEARAKNAHRELALDDWQILAYGPRRMRLDLLPELPRLGARTLWMRGDRDRLVNAEVMDAALAATPGSRLVTVPGAGHIVPYDQPAAVAGAIREFLRESPGPSAGDPPDPGAGTAGA